MSITTHRSRALTATLAIALTTTFQATPTHAIVWTGNHPSSPNWDAQTLISMIGPRFTNWQGPPATAPGTGDVVDFGDGFGIGGFASGNPTLSGNRTVDSLRIFHSVNQTIIAASADTLSLESGDIARHADSTGVHTIASPILLLDSGEWGIDGADRLDINTAIDGSFGLTKTGAAILRYEGAASNTYTGQTTVSAGRLTLAKTGGATAVPGDLLIDGTGLVLYPANISEQIDSAATVTVDAPGATYDLADAANTETVTTFNADDGTTRLGGGTLVTTNFNANGGTIKLEGGTLDTNNLNGAADIALGLNGSITIGEGDYTGNITGTGTTTLTKKNNGNFVMFSNGTSTVHTLNLEDGKIVVTSDTTLQATGPTTINSAAIFVQSTSTFSASENVDLDHSSSLLRQANATFNLAPDKSVTASNVSTLDFSGHTTIDPTHSYSISIGSAFFQKDDMTIDGGALTLDDNSELDMTGQFGSPAVPGHTLTMQNGATLDVTKNSQITLDGGESFSTTPGPAADAGTFNLVNGTINLSSNSTLTISGGLNAGAEALGTNAGQFNISGGTANLDGTVNLNGGEGIGEGFEGGNGGQLNVSGGTANLNANVNLNGAGSSGEGAHGGHAGSVTVSGGSLIQPSAGVLVIKAGPGSHGCCLDLGDGSPGDPGSFTVSGGSATLAGTLDLAGPDGIDGPSNTQLPSFGGDGGTLAVSSGSATLTSTALLTGGLGGTASGTTADGGDGGNGGTVEISGGTLTLDTGAMIDLTPGLGGTGASSGDDGADGNPGSVNVSGGTLVLNAGIITGDNTVSPPADTTNLAALIINLSLGAIDASATSTTISDASTYTQTGGAATFDTLTVHDSGTLITINGGTFTINNNLTMRAGTINGPIGGATTLTKDTTGMATLSGTLGNSYTGLTTMNDGDLDLNKSPGVNAIGGNLTINGGDVWLRNNEQIPDTATATVIDGAIRLFGNDETFTNLVLNAPGQTHLGGGNLTTDTLSGDGKIFFADLTNTNSYTVNQGAFSGEITGRGHLIKQTPGSLTFSGTTDPADQIFFDVNDGLLHLQNATLQSPDDTVTVNTGATLKGAFTTAGSVILNDGATFEPGNSHGIVEITGDLTLAPTATLTVEAEATFLPTPGTTHDLINVTNNVQLAGTLDVTTLPDPATFIADTDLGTQFVIMNYGTRTADSMFDAYTGTLLDTDFAIVPLINDTDTGMTLRASIPGDLNFDDAVSVADLAEFALNFDTTPGLYDEALAANSWELGDFNSDGAITVADLSLLALNFGSELLADGTTTPATGLSLTDAALIAGIDPTTIPEPTIATLILLLTAYPLTKRPTTY